MFRLVIDMESVEPPLSLTGSGPFSVRTDTYVKTREEAFTALRYVLDGLGVLSEEDDK